MAMSDFEDDDDTEESDFEVQDEDGTPRYGQPSNSKTRIRTSRKKLNQKNIKSKLTALLKRFKAQDETAGPSTGRLPPTEEELEEIFEELEDISDSGPELEPDKMSIISNPKPGLRPFFGSKTDILPPIEDRVSYCYLWIFLDYFVFFRSNPMKAPLKLMNKNLARIMKIIQCFWRVLNIQLILLDLVNPWVNVRYRIFEHLDLHR